MRPSYLHVAALLQPLRFHHPARRAVALLLHGPAYLALRDRCCNTEPLDDTRRRTFAHGAALESVATVKALNTSNALVTSAPLGGPKGVSADVIRGVVVSVARPCGEKISSSDLILRGHVYHHVVLFDGQRFVEFYAPSGREPANVHLDYAIAKGVVLSVVADESQPA